MADDKKPEVDDANRVRSESAVKADVREVGTDAVRVDADERLSYKDYAAQFKKPIVTIQRLIERKGPPKPKIRDFVPNIEVKQVVMWGEMPKEPAPMPNRAAATVHSYVLHVPPQKKAPPPSIGSMEPTAKG